MLSATPTRLLSIAALAGILLATQPLPAQRARGGHGPTAPAPHAAAPPRSAVGPQRNQEHLAQWMNRHGSLPLPEQQRVLEREPGFRDLSPEVQQRMRNRLSQLNTLSPEQRQRVMDRTEAMERLSPDQRQQVRGALSNLQELPLDRRRVVSRAFRELRSQPPEQRQMTLQSDQYRSQFTPEERSTLDNLIHVEPMLPPQP